MTYSLILHSAAKPLEVLAGTTGTYSGWHWHSQKFCSRFAFTV